MNEKRNDRQKDGGVQKDRQGQPQQNEERTPQRHRQVGGGGLGGGQKEGQERHGQRDMGQQRKPGRNIEEDVE